MELPLGQRYCIDTSSLIALKRHYFGDVFVSLWNNIGQMAEEGALIAPSEAHDEIERRTTICLFGRKNIPVFLWDSI